MKIYQRTVPAAGTPVQLTTEAKSYCNGMHIFAEKANMAANTGPVYVGTKGMNKTSGAGVIAKIASGGSYAIDTSEPGHVNGIWVDADNNADGVRIVFP